MELRAILLVAVGGFALLAVRRHRRDSHDAAVTESAGTGWRFRSELPHDVGPPFSYFAPDLWLVCPSDVMEGIEEGFEVAYFTVADGRIADRAVEAESRGKASGAGRSPDLVETLGQFD